jgi:hypothetical protein
MYMRYVILAGLALIALPLTGNRALGARSMLMSLDGAERQAGQPWRCRFDAAGQYPTAAWETRMIGFHKVFCAFAGDTASKGAKFSRTSNLIRRSSAARSNISSS